MMTMSSTLDSVLSAVPGKSKTEDTKPPYHPAHKYLRLLRCQRSFSSPLLFFSLLALSLSLLLLLSFFFLSSSSNSHSPPTPSWGGRDWEKRVRSSARIRTHQTRRGLSVFVTGAAGFIGAHVTISLKRRGDGVLGLDNFNNYYDPSLKRSRQSLLLRYGVFVVEGDINDSVLLRKLFDVVPFTHVLHLAAQPGVRHALRHPHAYVSSNIAGLVSLLEACRSADPQPAFIWASSSSVYGLNSASPFSELDRTDRPASLYAATKKAGEEITHSYNHIYGLSITALRFFTVYGPWGRPDMAYFSFTKDILRRKPIRVFDGATRDFTYIDDIVKGCLAALDTAKKSTGSRGKKRGPAQLRVYNLGNTMPVPVVELVGMLEKMLKVKAERKVVAMPLNGDVQFTHANITLAQRELGYEPTTDLKTGLKRFVRWYLEYYSPSSLRKKGIRRS